MGKSKKTVLTRALLALGLLALCAGLAACSPSGGGAKDNSNGNSAEPSGSTEKLVVSEASQAMRQALIDDWQAWMAKTEMERAVSDKMPGSCWKYFRTWAEAVDYLGFEPWNPLETADWLEKMNYGGADILMPGDSDLMHVDLSWNGENAGADTQVAYYALTAGYADGKVRVVIQISSDVYSTGELKRTDNHGEKYDSSDLEFSRDGLQYRVSVISYEGTAARDATYDKVYKALFNQ